MPIMIEQPTIIEAGGDKFERIEEYIGRINSRTKEDSIALVVRPPKWHGPDQRPEFMECLFVLKGVLQVESESEEFIIHPDEAIIIKANERVKFSTPDEGGAEYFSICVPAFSQTAVHRDE
jgi:mannose-6-phosphate isomerase-like protein (cupin superfamily)